MYTLTKQQFTGTIEILKGMIEAVQQSPNGLPSGHLYAHCLSHMSLHQYKALLDIMLKSGKVKKHGDLLVAGSSYNGRL